jgi:hypothetical protein
MEGFPKESKGFLKKYTDFLSEVTMSNSSNDNEFQAKLLPEDREIFANITNQIAAGKMTKVDVLALLTGISQAFLEIHTSAMLMRDRLNAKTIQEYIRDYRSWSRVDLLVFVNNSKNQEELKKRPALTLALYELLDRSTL